MQLGAIRPEPILPLPEGRHQLLDQMPETIRVVHLFEMGHFVGHHIIDNRLRGHDQPPTEAKPAGRRTAPPPASRVAHCQPGRAAAECGRLSVCARRKLAHRFGFKKVEQATFEMIGPATDPEFRLGAKDRPALIRNMANAMVEPEIGHTSPIDKAQGSRDRRQSLTQPADVPADEPVDIVVGNMRRRNDRRRSCPRIDAQAEPPRLSRPSQGYRIIEFRKMEGRLLGPGQRVRHSIDQRDVCVEIEDRRSDGHILTEPLLELNILL